MSQPDLAKKAHIHPDRLRAILGASNRRDVSVEELYAIAEATGVPRAFMESGFEGPTGAAVTGEGIRGELAKQRAELAEQRAALERAGLMVAADDANATAGPAVGGAEIAGRAARGAAQAPGQRPSRSPQASRAPRQK